MNDTTLIIASAPINMCFIMSISMNVSGVNQTEMFDSQISPKVS